MQADDFARALEVAVDQKHLSDPPYPHEVPIGALYDDDAIPVLRCAVCRWPVCLSPDGLMHLDSRLNP